jgi:hypothetical protein
MNFTLLKQKILGKHEKESEEFKAKRKRVTNDYREQLVKAQKAIQIWLDGSSKLSSAAQQLAEVAASNDPDLLKLGSQISIELGPERGAKACNECIDSIGLKIKLMDKLKKTVSDLDEQRLVRDRLQRKSEEAGKKGDAAEHQRLAGEHAQAVVLCDSMFCELDGSLDFLEEEAGPHGGFGLARAELDAFKRVTCDFFARCNDICVGLNLAAKPAVDVAQEWRSFNDRKEAKINKTKAEHMASAPPAPAPPAPGANASGANFSGGPPPPPPPPPAPGGVGMAAPAPALVPGGSAKGGFAQGGSSRAAGYGGTAPPPPPPQPQPAKPPSLRSARPQARALYAYAPQAGDELQLRAGDMISVDQQMDDGWWSGTLPDGRNGVFPSNYVQMEGGGGGDDDAYGAAV